MIARTSADNEAARYANRAARRCRNSTGLLPAPLWNISDRVDTTARLLTRRDSNRWANTSVDVKTQRGLIEEGRARNGKRVRPDLLPTRRRSFRCRCLTGQTFRFFCQRREKFARLDVRGRVTAPNRL